MAGRGDTDSNTVMEDMKTPLSSTDWSIRQIVNKETTELFYTMDQMDLIYIYRLVHPMAAAYTIFLSMHKTFSKVDDTLGNTASLNKLKTTEAKPCTFPHHIGMKLEICDHMQIEHIPEWIVAHIKKIKKEIQTFLEIDDNTIYWNLQNTGKEMLNGTFIANNEYINKLASNKWSINTSQGPRETGANRTQT